MSRLVLRLSGCLQRQPEMRDIGRKQCVKDGYRTEEDIGVMPKTKRIYGYPNSQPTEQEKQP